MISNKLAVNNEGVGMEEAFAEVEKVAAYQSLTPKQALRLRLLAEEMMGLVRGIVGKFSAYFWAEGEGKNIELWLEAMVLVDDEARRQLLSVASDGKNFHAKGVVGKLRSVMESFLVGNAIASEYIGGIGSVMSYGDVPGYGYDQMWSLCTFRSDVGQRAEREPEAREEWDELEKSVLANLADEVLVGLRAGKVQLVIRKAF